MSLAHAPLIHIASASVNFDGCCFYVLILLKHFITDISNDIIILNQSNIMGSDNKYC